MSNVQQTETTVNSELAAKRRAAAIKAAVTRWANRKPTVDEQDLGRDMTLEEAKALTPEQKKIRTNLRKAKWWRERYNAEKNGTAPVSTVTSSVVNHPQRLTQMQVVERVLEPSTVVHVNQDHVPEQFRHLFTTEEIHALRPMSMEEVRSLTKLQYKRRTALKARLTYQMNKDSIRMKQKAYVKRKSAERRGEVATQPVTEIAQAAPPQAMPIKLDHCPFCMARFWGVKGKDVVE